MGQPKPDQLDQLAYVSTFNSPKVYYRTLSYNRKESLEDETMTGKIKEYNTLTGNNS